MKFFDGHTPVADAMVEHLSQVLFAGVPAEVFQRARMLIGRVCVAEEPDLEAADIFAQMAGNEGVLPDHLVWPMGSWYSLTTRWWIGPSWTLHLLPGFCLRWPHGTEVQVPIRYAQEVLDCQPHRWAKEPPW